MPLPRPSRRVFRSKRSECAGKTVRETAETEKTTGPYTRWISDETVSCAVGGTETIIIIYRTNVSGPTAFYLVKRASCNFPTVMSAARQKWLMVGWAPCIRADDDYYNGVSARPSTAPTADGYWTAPRRVRARGRRRVRNREGVEISVLVGEKARFAVALSTGKISTENFAYSVQSKACSVNNTRSSRCFHVQTLLKRWKNRFSRRKRKRFS